MKKRLLYAAIGFAYAIVYGFWTMMITGGGHGNFLWFMLFLSSYLRGLYFPAIGFVGADLRPLWAQATGIALSIVAFGLAVIQLLSLGDEGIEDVVKSWDRSPLLFVIASVIHLAPAVVFFALVIRSLIRDDSYLEAENQPTSFLP
jgi:hypothetical protein